MLIQCREHFILGCLTTAELPKESIKRAGGKFRQRRFRLEIIVSLEIIFAPAGGVFLTCKSSSMHYKKLCMSNKGLGFFETTEAAN